MLYEVFTGVWQLVGSIVGILVLYGLVMALIDHIGGNKNADE